MWIHLMEVESCAHDWAESTTLCNLSFLCGGIAIPGYDPTTQDITCSAFVEVRYNMPNLFKLLIEVLVQFHCEYI